MPSLSQTYRIQNSGISRTVIAGEFEYTSYLPTTPNDDQNLDHAWWSSYLQGKAPSLDSTSPVRVVDLFCGSGGLTLGAKAALAACGLRAATVAAADVDTAALSIYAQNFKPERVLASNVGVMVDYAIHGSGEKAKLAYEPELIEPNLSSLIGSVDLLLAGPPCQGHSNLNNHTRRDDPRNQLYLAVTAAAVAIRPKALVIENVPDVQLDKKNVVATAVAVLKSVGYHVSIGVLNTTHLGGPQTRKRHFLVATLHPHFAINDAAKTLRSSPMSLRQAIGDLEHLPRLDFMDDVAELSDENKRRIDVLHSQDSSDELPDSERPDCHKNGHTYPSVYGRLSWEKPAQTITTGFLTPGRGRYVHPTQRRTITPREAARIQGFPDGFSFALNGKAPARSLLAKWIGDAVPAWLGYGATLAALSGVRAG